eukprot:6435543-Pyramimonas_sp.AAC.1
MACCALSAADPTRIRPRARAARSDARSGPTRLPDSMLTDPAPNGSSSWSRWRCPCGARHPTALLL